MRLKHAPTINVENEGFKATRNNCVNKNQMKSGQKQSNNNNNKKQGRAEPEPKVIEATKSCAGRGEEKVRNNYNCKRQPRLGGA